MLLLCTALLVVFLVAFVIVGNCFLIYVRENSSVVLFSMGRFSRVLHPGPHFISPLENVVRVFWTANNKALLDDYSIPRGLVEIDLLPVLVMTSDGFEYLVDTRLKIRVTDVRKAVCCNQNVTNVIEKDVINCIQNVAHDIAHDNLRSSVDVFKDAAMKILSPTEETTGVCLASFNIERIYPSEALAKTQRETMNNKLVSEQKLKAAETDARLQQQAVELEQSKVKAALRTQEMMHEQSMSEKRRMAQLYTECDSNRLEMLAKRAQQFQSWGVPESTINNIFAGETLRYLAQLGVRHLYSASDVARVGLMGMVTSMVQPLAIQEVAEQQKA